MKAVVTFGNIQFLKFNNFGGLDALSLPHPFSLPANFHKCLTSRKKSEDRHRVRAFAGSEGESGHLGTKNLNIKLRDSQVSFVEEAILGFMAKCPLRFSEPTVANGVLTTDPHDFEELINYINMTPENELELARLKRLTF